MLVRPRWLGNSSVETIPMGFRSSRIQGTAVTAPVPRRANGTVMPGYTANPGGRPRSLTDTLKEKYRNRLPELMDRLFLLTGPNNPPMVQIAAIRELLDRLLGKPQVTIEATTARWDAGAMYLAALKRVNAEMQPANYSRVLPGADVVEEKANEIDTGKKIQ
jgi:hypothetical protein